MTMEMKATAVLPCGAVYYDVEVGSNLHSVN